MLQTDGQPTPLARRVREAGPGSETSRGGQTSSCSDALPGERDLLHRIALSDSDGVVRFYPVGDGQTAATGLVKSFLKNTRQLIKPSFS